MAADDTREADDLLPVHVHNHTTTRSSTARLTTALHKLATPRTCLAAVPLLLLIALAARWYVGSAGPGWPLPVACCGHTSYHPRLRIVAVGDSITEYGGRQGGWVSLLAAHYVRHADVYNRGYAGYNTRTYLALLRQQLSLNLWPWQPSADVDDGSAATGRRWKRLVTLYLGTNDAALPNSGTNETRIHTPLDEYTANLRAIIALLLPEYSPYQSSTSAPPTHYLSPHTALILLTPAQLNLTAWQLRNLHPPYPHPSTLPVTRTLATTAQYAAAAAQLASDWHLPVVDLWAATAVESDWAVLLDRDGLHLGGGGNRMVYDAVMAVVRQAYGELEVRGMGEDGDEVSRLEWDAPLYWQIDYRDIAGSFAVKQTDS